MVTFCRSMTDQMLDFLRWWAIPTTWQGWWELFLQKTKLKEEDVDAFIIEFLPKWDANKLEDLREFAIDFAEYIVNDPLDALAFLSELAFLNCLYILYTIDLWLIWLKLAVPFYMHQFIPLCIDFFYSCLLGYLPLFIIFTPLFVGLALLCFGRFVGIWGSSALSVFFSHLVLALASFCFIFNLFYESINYSYVFVEFAHFSYYWGSLERSLVLTFDFISVNMSFLISVVATLVITYSVNYLRSDPHRARFLMFLSFFFFLCFCWFHQTVFLFFF